MAVRETIARYNLIIQKLQQRRASAADILEHLSHESGLQDYDFNISIRTFQRDIAKILSLYGIEIVYDRSSKEYYIASTEQDVFNERILEAFDVINTLSITQRNANYIHLENRRPRGTEHLFGIMHAIKNQLIIKFTYHNYWKNTFSQRQPHAYALKEFRNRWYVLARDQKDNVVKSFALDRMSELEITTKKFTIESKFDVSQHYKYCFGIVGPTAATGGEPQEVILSFSPYQGHYIKSLPLHPTQEVIIDDEKEFQIRLKVYITEDLRLELLSYSKNLTVLAPQILVDELKVILKAGLGRYKNQ